MTKREAPVKRVPSTGLYRVQKGMEVIPATRVKKLRGMRKMKKLRKIGRAGGR